jgi:molecular chaperone HscB
MKNFFEIFKIPQKFEIDLEQLEQKYFQFQKQFHPDSASFSDIEKSIEINKAYKILSNSIARASYILQLNKIDIENDSCAPKPDLATLEEILELQEMVAEISANQAQNLRKNLQQRIKILLQEVAKKLENKEFEAAAQVLIKTKYFDKTLRDLKELKNNVSK